MSPINILYVEDNDDIRDMVLKLIKSEHLRFVSYANAEDARLRLQRDAFDVLVTDVSLPGRSGAELARRWIEGDTARFVILFSGFDFQSDLTSLGANVRSIPKEDIEQLERVLSRSPSNCSSARQGIADRPRASPNYSTSCHHGQPVGADTGRVKVISGTKMRTSAAPCNTDGGILGNSVCLVKFGHTRGMPTNISKATVAIVRSVQSPQ